MIVAVFWVFAGLVAPVTRPAAPPNPLDLPAFVLSLQADLQARRFDAYLESYSPALRPAQRDALDLFFNRLKMETVHLYLANREDVSSPTPTVYVQAIYENAFSVLVECWQLSLSAEPGRWTIRDKQIRGSVNQLFKIRIPADRVIRAPSVEIDHADIRLTFKNALVFFDNIPDIDSAALVIGQGTVAFSPSDPNESHQLQLVYKSPRLQDSISYAYVRCSPSFFENHVLIKGPREAVKPTEEEKALASALFKKLSPRFFTIQTPLSPEPLSFIPQGDEATFEFLGRKTGDMSYAYSAFADEEVILFNRTRGRFVNLYSPSSGKDKRRLVITFGEKYDVQHYDLELDFDPDETRLSGRARITVLARLGDLESLQLKLNPAFEILHVYDAERRELFFTEDKASRALYVYLLEPVPAGRTVLIEVLYRGRVAPSAQLQDALALGQQSDLVMATAPRFETYFYGQSAAWYPEPPSEDFFTARLRIIVPPGLTAIANGRLTERGTLNGTRRVTELDKVGRAYMVYEIAEPVRYLSFLVGKLSLTEEQTQAPPLATYVASDVLWLRRNFLDDARRIMAFYAERFGPFPFASLSIVQRLWSTAGGHSPASFLVVDELPRRPNAAGAIGPLVPSANNPADLSQWKDYFLAHEIAHQWWGQGVSGQTYRDQWLSEGLAQFSSILYLRSRYGEDAFAAILKKFSRWTARKSVWGPITLGSRLSYVDFEAFQSIVYDKAALALNMLRDMMGEPAFFLGLRDFFAAHERSAATTGQFRAAMEKASGRGLADFFDPWFSSHELPNVRVGWTAIRGADGPLLRLRVEQAGPAFVFPLWVTWRGADGRVYRDKVVVERRSQEFELRAPAGVRRFAANPEGAVPGRFVVAGG